MFTTAIHGESLIKEIIYNNLPLELIFVPATIWCGSVAFAPNLTDEPDISALIQKYQQNCQYPKLHRANPDWTNAISIDYWQEGNAPRGMMFSQQVTSDEQNSVHDIYRMPQSLYIRLSRTSEVAQAAFGRDECEVFELFGVIKDTLDDLGYKVGTNGAQEIEMYNHSAGLAYAYVQVEDNTLKQNIADTHSQEKVIGTFDYNGINVDLIRWSDTIWCGKIGYAVNNVDEPDVEKIADDAKIIFPNNTPKNREENWEVCISLNYLSKERPNGVMFGFLVESDEQPDSYDVVKVPESLYMKIQICNDTFEALGVEPWTGGIPPYEWIGELIAPKLGYTYGDDTLPIVEYYKHNPVTYAIEACYLYVPVQKI